MTTTTLPPATLKRAGVRFDWTVNLTHILSVIIYCVGIVVAWTDLKSDQRDMRTRAELKYADYDERWRTQRSVDDEQNQRVVRAVQQMTDAIKDTKTDLKADLRDLRNEITRVPRTAR